MIEASLAMGAEAASTWLGADKGSPREGIAAAAVRVERVPSGRIAIYKQAWADLCGRALEANVFLEPGFALPLMQHVAPRRRPEIFVVWERRSDACERMIGLFPVSRPRLPIFGQASGFRDRMATLGVPLLDRDSAQAAFAAMLQAIEEGLFRPVALTLTGVPADGRFMQTVVRALEPTRRAAVLASHERAVLRRSGESAGNVLSLVSAKTRKERKRQRRRLADQGSRAYVSARSPEAVGRAIERFLILEQKGWKGERGTALLASANDAAFARAMTCDMASKGQCRIDALELNGQAVAMGIILTSGRCAHFWKTAFDEALAPLSPGVQFATDLAEAQLADAEIDLTDSCAIPDHPMIDKVWLDRLAIIDVAIALRPGASRRLALGLALERARRRARGWAKRLRARF